MERAHVNHNRSTYVNLPNHYNSNLATKHFAPGLSGRRAGKGIKWENHSTFFYLITVNVLGLFRANITQYLLTLVNISVFTWGFDMYTNFIVAKV